MSGQNPAAGGRENTPCEIDKKNYRERSDEHFRSFCTSGCPCPHQAPSGLEAGAVGLLYNPTTNKSREYSLSAFCNLVEVQKPLPDPPEQKAETKAKKPVAS